MGVWMGTFLQMRRILNSEVKVCNLGLGRLSDVVFHGRLLGGSFAGMGQGGCVPGYRSLVSGHARTVAKTIFGVHEVQLLQMWVSPLL